MSIKKISQNNIVFLGCLFGLYILYFIFKPHYNHSYHYSKDKSQVVTIMHYYWIMEYWREESYLIEGYYTSSNTPSDYIEITRTHEFFLAWKNDTCVLYSPEFPYNVIGNPSKLKQKEPSGEEWIRAKTDTTGTYFFQYSG